MSLVLVLALIYSVTFGAIYANAQNLNVIETKASVEKMPAHDSVSVGSLEDSVGSLEDLQLPPLSVFLESVYEHPSALIYKTFRDEEAAKLKVEKRKWMNYLKATANYQYGQNAAYVEGVGPISYSNESRSYYSVGASISVPIGDLAGNKHRVQAQREKLKRVDYEYEMTIEDRKLVVLEAYNNVTQLWSVLKAKAEAVTLYDAQMKISENDYINGKISIIELSLERGRRSNAVVTYQEARTSLQSAIILLEMLTNIKIVK